MEKFHGLSWPSALVLCGLLPLIAQAGKEMPKLADKKLCADAECSREYIFFSFASCNVMHIDKLASATHKIINRLN